MSRIQDVATEAGVSISTVSYVINGTRRISPETTRRVFGAMDALGVSSSDISRGPRAKKLTSLWAVVPDICTPFFAALVRGVEETLYAAGYTLGVSNTDEDPDKETRYLQAAASLPIAGLVIAPTIQPAPILRNLQKRIPVIFVDRKPQDLIGPLIATDNVAAAAHVVEHLRSHHRTRVAAVLGRPAFDVDTARYAGYRAALGELFDASRVRFADATRYLDGWTHSDAVIDAAMRCTFELLDDQPMPDGLYCANNRMMTGALKAIRARGLAVPEQLAVVGTDDVDWAEATAPALTVTAQAPMTMGRQAAELLLQQLDSPSLPLQEAAHVVESRLVIRQSCGCHEGPDTRTA